MNLNFNFEGKVVLVTGGSSGLGRAIAMGFAKAGASIAITYQSRKKEAMEIVNQIIAKKQQAIAFKVDSRNKYDIDEAVKNCICKFGKIDILINNAGILTNTDFLSITQEEWDMVLEINLRGYFLFSQAVARQMVKQRAGRIINVSSTRQIQANPGNVSYCASKGGIFMLTRVMATELSPYGIRVNSIAPGTIPTNLNPMPFKDQEFVEKRIASIPVGKFGRPEDVVGATLFLAAEEADFINGASLTIDGGQTIW